MDAARSFRAADGALQLRVWPSEGKRPLLMVHGMAGNSHWWDYVAPLLSRDFAPAALDLGGHGDSAWHEDGNYPGEGFVEDIEQARLALGWEKFFLCGHSFGARMSLDYAIKHPRRLLGLIAADFMPEYRQPNPKKKSFLARFKPRQPFYKEREDIIGRFHLQPPGNRMDAARFRALAESCVRQMERGFTWKTDWRIFTFLYESARPIFPRLGMPCLIIRGEFSTVMERQDFEGAVKAVPGARGLEIRESFHHVPLDTPREFAAAVSDFVLGLEKKAMTS